MNSICLVVDRLQAGFLGTYGNSWIATPALDRLAAESFVFDQAYLDSPELERQYSSLWTGRHALQADTGELHQSMPAMLSAAGINTVLLTDEPRLVEHRLAAGFAEIVPLELPASAAAAEEIEQTQLNLFFAAAVDWISSARQPFCLWLHIGSLGKLWDAPRELRDRYVDDEAIAPPEFVMPPARHLPPGFDPDELLPLRWAYAAQVSLLDLCLGAFWEQILAASLADSTLLAMTSNRGYPLGEHLQIGPPADVSQAEPLHEELIHLPLIVRLPQAVGAAARSQSLVQPADLAATLLDWWSLPQAENSFGQSMLPLVREESNWSRDRLWLGTSDTECALRTPAWFLRVSESASNVATSGMPSSPQLFAKPADRWEVNEVASRCGEIVEQLLAAQAATRLALSTGDGSPLPPLANELVSEQA